MAALVGWVGITVLGRAGVVAVVDGAPVVVVEVVELLEQAAARMAIAPIARATVAF
jgi:hypothetical protein